MPVTERTHLKRGRSDLGRCSVFGPATSWDTYYNGTQFGNSLLATLKREFLSSIEDVEVLLELERVFILKITLTNKGD
jgi:hypothetical protein